MSNVILAATDLSARSDRALYRAAKLARDTGAKLHILHAIDDDMPPEMTETVQARAEETLDHQCAGLRDGIDVTLTVTTGDPTRVMLDAVRDIAPRLLVVGRHRPRPFLDMIRETTVMRVARLAACPLLLVRNPGESPVEKVLAAVDFSPASDAALALSATLFPKATHHPLHAVHVPYSGMLAPSSGGADLVAATFIEDAKVRADAWDQTNPTPTQPIALRHGASNAIVWQEAENLQADLICAGAHDRSGAAPALLGSLANDLLRDAPCDVLLARP